MSGAGRTTTATLTACCSGSSTRAPWTTLQRGPDGVSNCHENSKRFARNQAKPARKTPIFVVFNSRTILHGPLASLNLPVSSLAGSGAVAPPREPSTTWPAARPRSGSRRTAGRGTLRAQGCEALNFLNFLKPETPRSLRKKAVVPPSSGHEGSWCLTLRLGGQTFASILEFADMSLG